jgi:hypothetical protein
VLVAVATYGCGLGLVIPAGNLATTGARNVMLLNLAEASPPVSPYQPRERATVRL